MSIRLIARNAAVSLFLLALLAACELQNQADSSFGDQHFKTAISLIELHRVRHGAYPDSLEDLKHLGEWDGIAISSVEYQRLADGYELNLSRGWVGTPALSYPADFWKGLGLRSSNVGGMPGVKPSA